MNDNVYGGYDGGPQTDDGFARLDALLGLSPPPPGPHTDMTRERFDELFARALVIADAHAARGQRMGRRRLLGWMVGGAVTATAAVTGVASLLAVDARRPRAAYGATPAPLAIVPAPDGAPVTLTQLALAAQRTGGAHAAVDHLVIESWEYDSYVDDRQVTSAVIPTRRELWRTADDGGRTIETFLPPDFPEEADRRAWREAGSPHGGPPVDTPYGPGELSVSYHSRPPRDTQVLAGWLTRSHTGSAAILKGVLDLLRERALTGPECGAVLRVLAAHARMVYAGRTVDRAGRAGVAFTARTSDGGGDDILVFVMDPRTGRFLATEKILTSGAPRWDVRRPAVIAYRTYLVAEQVRAIPA